MYQAIVQTHFSSAHRLRGYEGECEALHGHNWKVSLEVTAERLNNLGMVADFKALKRELALIIQGLDHRYLNEVPPFERLNPTSENLARCIFESLSNVINDERIRVTRVTVWESETSQASFST